MGGTLKFWDPADGQELRTLKGHAGSVHGLAFSPDRRLLASASHEGVKLWDAASKQEPRTLEGHASYVHSVAFSPDGRLLASGGQNSEVIIWDAILDRPLLTYSANTLQLMEITY